MSEQSTELLDLSRQLLKAIETQNWEQYTLLCDADLTAFEPEARGHLVQGLDFHHFYFKLSGSGKPRQSTMIDPRVQVFGETALVTYVRLTQSLDENGTPQTSACEETRIWHRKNGQWKHVHFHRSV